MKHLSTFLLFFMFIGVIISVKIEEFCENHLKIECEAADDALMIKNAVYGLYGIGKCTNRTGGVDCPSDLTVELNKHCLGRRKCEIRDIKRMFKGHNKCESIYSLFLKVEYICEKVERASCISCAQLDKAVVTSGSGFLASFVSHESRCGQISCPWSIKGKSGQKINLTIHDYSVSTHHSNNHYSGEHRKLFMVDDGINQAEEVKAGLPAVRTVYTSLNNHIDLRVINSSHPFLIQFKIWGCEDLDSVGGMWVERNQSHMRAGCVPGEVIWSRMCVGNEWKGLLGSCDEVMLLKSMSASMSDFFTTLPFSVIIAAVISISIILSVCILTIGFVCYRKSGAPHKSSKQSSSMVDQYVDINDPNSSLVQKIMATQKKKYLSVQRENKYAMNNRMPVCTRPLPSAPDNRGAPPRMMIRSYGEAANRQSAGNKYYSIEHTLGEVGKEDLDMFPPPPELLQNPDCHSIPSSYADKGNIYENQQAILGTMATAGITAAAAASCEMLNKSMNSGERNVKM